MSTESTESTDAPDTGLKARLKSDLTDAMRSRDELTMATVRMALSAITNEEVAGKAQRTLTDEEVLVVLTREAKKRKESATAFREGDREERAVREEAEGEVLGRYLPTQLGDDELAAIVAEAVASSGATSMQQMGLAMKSASAAVAGRAEGGRVAALVRSVLAAG